MKSVSHIMSEDFVTVDILTSVLKVQNIAVEKGINYFPVVEDNKLIGVTTYKNLITTHPNRIIADAMSTNIVSISSDSSIWEAKEKLNQSKSEVLFVLKDGKLLGVVNKTILFMELGKHVDPLTGLYKSDYIYYNGAELISNNIEVSVVFIDVDKFGHIDKKYGHIKGDIVLKEISSLLEKNLPEETYLCRFGGDEFVILTSYLQDRCIILTKKLLSTVASHSFIDDIKITASAGISGGKRNKIRNCNAIDTVTNLINLASLASAKAKKDKSGLAVFEEVSITETA